VKLAAADGMESGVLNNEIYRPEGGVWAHIDDNATYVRTVSTLRSGGPPTPRWGEVERIVYRYPADLVDISNHPQQRQGWTQLPTIAAQSYDGRTFEGDMQW